MRKVTARYQRLDLNKDGVLSSDDFKTYNERAVQFGNMTPDQIEASSKKTARIIAHWFGTDDKHITLEEFKYVCAVSAAGKYMRCEVKCEGRG